MVGDFKQIYDVDIKTT